jgi:DNA-binding NtrC family response regulator
MKGVAVVVGATELFETIRPLAPAGLSVVHLESSRDFGKRLEQYQPALIFLETGQEAVQETIAEFLDRSDDADAFLYLLAPRYDLAEAEEMLMGRRRVVRYAALDMLDDPRIRDEMQRFLLEAHERSQEAAQSNRKRVGWLLSVTEEDYEERRLVSLFIGEMGAFMLKLRVIVDDLRQEWKRFAFSNPFQHISVVKQLDDWHRWEVIENEPQNPQEKKQFQEFKKKHTAYRLFQQAPPRGFRPTTILIRGETGTGKSLVVRLIHKWLFGDGKTPFETVKDTHPFQELNCIGIPDSLLESELFGAMAGAYTDHGTTSPGKILPAYGGTLFLDEVGDMPVALQGKLLKFLDDSRVDPVGWTGEGIFVPLNIVAATNADLEAKIRQKTFREDLYYRLRGNELTIPSLKERLWDLERMVDFLLQNPRVNRQDARGRRYVNYIHDQALAKLRAYEFKGNFRDLESILYGAIIEARLEGVETLMDRHIAFPRAAEDAPRETQDAGYAAPR